MKKYSILLLTIIMLSCSNRKALKNTIEEINTEELNVSSTSIVILGTIQDAGSPQIGCKKACCSNLFENPDNNRHIVSLGLIDVPNSKSYLFEATPDIVPQMKKLTGFNKQNDDEIANGIFLTHAHIGHYTGLMFLGKEAMDAKNTVVYAMPRMKEYLVNNAIIEDFPAPVLPIKAIFSPVFTLKLMFSNAQFSSSALYLKETLWNSISP